MSGLEERRAMMLGGAVVPTLLKLTFPVIAVVVAQTFVAILEAYWVSRLGTEAVAGVSLVLPILSALLSFAANVPAHAETPLAGNWSGPFNGGADRGTGAGRPIWLRERRGANDPWTAFC